MAAENVFSEMLVRVRRANEALITAGVLPAGIDQSRVSVEPPRDPAHGDMATNAAMVLAKDAGKKPRDLAASDCGKTARTTLWSRRSMWPARDSSISLLSRRRGSKRCAGAVRLGMRYGSSDIGGGTAINVEYVSANPTGPMHIGHCRGAVFGDALANLLAFTGFKVTREYYINDAGAQVDVLARSAYLRYREALGQDIGGIPEGLYPGDYLKPVGKALADEHGDALTSVPEAQWLPVVRAKAIDMMMEAVRADLAALNISFDVFFSERSLIQGAVDQVAATIDWLRARGEVYEGRLPPPKGATVEDWEDREQTLFHSTAFGDDIDRALKKSDGSYTYFASDIAYHRSKLERGFRALIDVWGADHGGYVKRMQAAVAALSDRSVALDIKLIQLVKLLRGGQPVTMSKRAGDFVTLREVVDEVGRDAVRFMMLFRKNDAVLEFDLAKVIEQSRDNPVFYVQYAHARGMSVFRNARAIFSDLPENIAALVNVAELDRLSDPGELALMRQIALYPRVVEGAAFAHEPHRIAFYLVRLGERISCSLDARQRIATFTLHYTE